MQRQNTLCCSVSVLPDKLQFFVLPLTVAAGDVPEPQAGGANGGWVWADAGAGGWWRS